MGLIYPPNPDLFSFTKLGINIKQGKFVAKAAKKNIKDTIITSCKLFIFKIKSDLLFEKSIMLQNISQKYSQKLYWTY